MIDLVTRPYALILDPLEELADTLGRVEDWLLFSDPRPALGFPTVLELSEILQLSVFERAGAEVIVGKSNLDRIVRWVHVFEVEAIDQVLRGGELLLTTGLPFGQNVPMLNRIIRDLAAVRVAGLVIELGQVVPSVPYACVQEAERVGLPLIVLHREAQFVQVTEEVQTAIVDRRADSLSRIDDLTSDLARLLLHGAASSELLHRLVLLVGNPVVLEDLAHQVIAVADPEDRVDEILQSWPRHARSLHEDPDRVGWGRTKSSPGCLWCVVTIRDEQLGRLHLLEMSKQSSGVDASILDRAAAAIGISLLIDRSPGVVADRARRSLISDVLQGRIHGRQEILLRARNLGADLEGRPLIAVVVGTSHLEEQAEAVTGRTAQELAPQDLLTAVRSAMRQAGAISVDAVEGKRVMAVVGLSTAKGMREEISRFSAALYSAALAAVTESQVFVGVSDESPVTSLRRAFEQATEAFEYGAKGAIEGAHLYSDLGIHHLLLRLSEGGDLALFVESELGPLFEYDAHSSSPLLPTLEAYLAAGSNKSAVARKLHIERRTLYHRIDRIESLLGRSLDQHEHAFRLEIAIRGLQVLRLRALPPDTAIRRAM
jgi:purine catabolism regulator